MYSTCVLSVNGSVACFPLNFFFFFFFFYLSSLVGLDSGARSFYLFLAHITNNSYTTLHCTLHSPLSTA